MRARIERAAAIIARPWRARLASAPGGASARIDRLLRLAVERFEPHGTRALARLAFAGSTIAARQIGKVSLSRVATVGPTLFGVLAEHSIQSVVAGRPGMRVSNRKAPVDLGVDAFRVRIV